MYRWVGQLHGVGSVAVSLPKDTLRVRHIRDKLPVFGEGDKVGGDAAKEGLKLPRFQVKSESSPRRVLPVAKIFFPSLPGMG